MSYVTGLVALFGLILLVAGVRIAREHERFAVFTLGRFTGFKGPGFVLHVPGMQMLCRIALRDEGTVEAGGVADVSGCPVPVAPDASVSPGDRIRVVGFRPDGARVERADG